MSSWEPEATRSSNVHRTARPNPFGILAAQALSPDVAWLDVRSCQSFQNAHRAIAGNLPLEEWTERRAELPPRGTPVLVIDDEPSRAHDAALRLAEAGYDAMWLSEPWTELPGTPERGAGARLWRPAPFLTSVLPAIPRGPAVDIACGAGREAVTLALHGFDVEAWDIDAAALDRARALAERNGVSIRTRAVDLEDDGRDVPEAAYALITCFRFLHRPLFPRLERALRPGGHLVYETYLQGQERFGRPRRPRFLLSPGELEGAFPALEILHYEEARPEGGPFAARLHARRPHPQPA